MKFLPTVTALTGVAFIGVALTGAAPTGDAPTGATPTSVALTGAAPTSAAPPGLPSCSTTNASCCSPAFTLLLVILGILSGPCSCAPTGLPTTQLDWSKYNLSDHASIEAYLRHTACVVNTTGNDGTPSPTTCVIFPAMQKFASTSLKKPKWTGTWQ
ncbi:hypothetical protein QBC45DRAFT_397425 [Copromyces sp. CBS 386.78]|nr:hypothetical protein QBC45DRAFT_397425 [Copromyces sp. CBS 386.78]